MRVITESIARLTVARERLENLFPADSVENATVAYVVEELGKVIKRLEDTDARETRPDPSKRRPSSYRRKPK